MSLELVLIATILLGTSVIQGQEAETCEQDPSRMAVYQLPVDGRFTCSGEITKYKLCFTNWTSNVTVTLVRFRAVQIFDQTVASTGVAHVQLVITDDMLARNDFLGVLRNGNHNASLSFYCNNYLGYTIPSSSGIQLPEISLVFTRNASELCPQVNGGGPSLGTILVLMQPTNSSISSNCYKKFESSMGRDNRTENNMTAGGSRGTCNPSTSYAEACQQTSQTTAVIIFLVAILVLETVLFGIALAACYLCCVKRNRSKKEMDASFRQQFPLEDASNVSNHPTYAVAGEATDGTSNPQYHVLEAFSDTYSEVYPSNNWRNGTARPSGGTLLRQDLEAEEPPQLESNYEMEETFWEPASTYEEVYQQIIDKNKEKLRMASGGVTLLEKLGEGEFGMVHKGEWVGSPQGPLQVAVKSLHSQEEESRYKLLKEAALLGQFSHPNVVKMLGVVVSDEQIMLIMEYLENGDLRNYLEKHKERSISLTPMHLLKICQEIAGAMEYLSKKGFIHRDLAARNILLDCNCRCKLGDFGMSRDLEADYYYKVKGGMIPVKWTAPEAILYRRYTTKSDVWSYGMVMYEIWSLGHKPFEDFSVEEVIQAFNTGYCQPPPPGCPRGVYTIMVKCWNPDCHSRLSFSDVHKMLLKDTKSLLERNDCSLDLPGAPMGEGQQQYKDLQNSYLKQQ